MFYSSFKANRSTSQFDSSLNCSNEFIGNLTESSQFNANENGIDIEVSYDFDTSMENSDPVSDENGHDFEETEDETNYFTGENVDWDSEDLRTLHPNTACSVLDLYCMIYAFSIRHSLTWVTTEDLMRLINRVIGREEISPSKYMLKKKIRQIANWTILKHFTCHQCDLYLGCKEDIEKLNKHCPNCQANIEMDTKYKKNHFITIPFKNHLQNILEKNSDRLIFDFQPSPTNICDVHDSLYFQNLRNEMRNDSFITLTFSLDGAPVHETAKDNK